MKYTLLDIVKAQEALKNLFDTPMGIQESELVLKGILEVDEVLKEFDKDKKKLFIDYGDEQEDGSYIVPDEKTDEFNKKVDALGLTEVKLENFPVYFGNRTNLRISPSMLFALSKFIMP